MQVTLESKINRLYGNFPFFSDETSELLAKKLSNEEITTLLKECMEGYQEKHRMFCQYLMELPRQKDRLRKIEEEAQEPEPKQGVTSNETL